MASGVSSQPVKGKHKETCLKSTEKGKGKRIVLLNFHNAIKEAVADGYFVL